MLRRRPTKDGGEKNESWTNILTSTPRRRKMHDDGAKRRDVSGEMTKWQSAPSVMLILSAFLSAFHRRVSSCHLLCKITYSSEDSAPRFVFFLRTTLLVDVIQQGQWQEDGWIGEEIQEKQVNNRNQSNCTRFSTNAADHHENLFFSCLSATHLHKEYGMAKVEIETNRNWKKRLETDFLSSSFCFSSVRSTDDDLASGCGPTLDPDLKLIFLLGCKHRPVAHHQCCLRITLLPDLILPEFVGPEIDSNQGIDFARRCLSQK